MSLYYSQIAEFYDADTENKTDDLLWFSQLAEQYGTPILDVGCGTGRVVLHLAQEGYEVYGLDYNKPMLDKLENKLKGTPHLRDLVHVQYADIFKYQAPQPFKLILFSYNMLMHFSNEKLQLELLQHVRKMLAEDGLVVFDLANPAPVYAAPDDMHLTLERTFLHPETNHMVMLQSISLLNRSTQMLKMQWIYDEIMENGMVKRTIAPHAMRFFFRSELNWLLKAAGLEMTAVFGDYDEGEYDDDCERMLVIAKRA